MISEIVLHCDIILFLECFLFVMELLNDIQFMLVTFEELMLDFQLLYLKLHLINFISFRIHLSIDLDFALDLVKSVTRLTHCLVLFYFAKCFNY